MKIGVIERFMVIPLPIDVFKAHIRELWTLHSNGVLREAYKFEDNAGSIFIVETVTLNEAKDIMARLPLVLVSLFSFRN